jgi:hypothetical protein
LRQFNFTSYLSDQPAPSSPALPQRDILHDIQNGASSILAVAATRVSDAASHVESAISSAAAALPQLEDYVPLNCSFGMRQFCVGYRGQQGLSCSSSAFDVSDLLPDRIQDLPAPVEDAFRERIADLSPLANHLSSLSTSVLVCLIVGSMMMIFMLALSCCLAHAWPSCVASISPKVGTKTRVLVHLAVSMLCSAPYLALVLLQSKVVREAKGLPGWVEVKQGEVFGLSVGILVCAAVFVALSVVVSSRKK